MSIALGIVATALLLVACGGSGGTDSTGQAASGEQTQEQEPTQEQDQTPIKVGLVASLTGPATLPAAAEGAEATFDAINAEGGIDGHPVELTVVDDKGDPNTMATVGRQLVEQDGVVANVGSTSLADCAVNGKLYEQSGMVSVTGIGADYACFHSPNISPVNTGPFISTAISLYYATTVLKAKHPCFLAYNIPGFAPGYDEAVSLWEELTGEKLTVDIRNMDPAGDPTPDVLKVRDAGCDVVFSLANDAIAVPLFKAIAAQGVEGIQWMLPTTAYTDGFLEGAGKSAEGVILNSEFTPYTSDDPALDDWRETMKSAGVPLSSGSIGGYLAAHIFAETVAGVEDISRDSVTEAFKSMAPYESPLVGTPYEFGPGDAHASNTASKFVQVKNGKYVVISDEWVKLPQ